MANIAPVALFTYNRPRHTRRAVEHLRKNVLAGQTELFVYSDGPRPGEDKEKTEAVRDYIETIDGFKNVTVTRQERNLGLANSIISGTTKVISRFGRVIVMEDDLVCSPYLLDYMNAALSFYENEPRIFSVSAYNHPPAFMKMPRAYRADVYFSYRSASCGWGTWADRWERVDWDVSNYEDFMQDPEAQRLFNRGGDDMTGMLTDQMRGLIDSWAIRFAYAQSRQGAYTVYPVHSHTNNIGLDARGTHIPPAFAGANDLSRCTRGTSFLPFDGINEAVAERFRAVYSAPPPTLKQRLCGTRAYRLFRKLSPKRSQAD